MVPPSLLVPTDRLIWAGDRDRLRLADDPSADRPCTIHAPGATSMAWGVVDCAAPVANTAIRANAEAARFSISMC